MDAGTLSDRIGSIAARAADARGVEFVHCQIAGSKRNPTVRIFIDKPGGVTVDDCANVSRDIEGVLDSEDLIPSSYVLEVSSPGIERGLFVLADYRKFAGKPVRVRMSEPLDGQRNFTGRVMGVDGDDILLEDKTRGEVRLPFEKIARANLVVDLANEFRRS
jgi:ribosome maturation factor RimP